MTSKAKSKPIRKVTFERETVPGRTLHIDISLVKRKSKGGEKIWLQIADEAMSKKWSFFLKKKSDQYEVIEKLFQGLKARGFVTKNIDVLVRRKIRLDNAGENKRLDIILKKKGFDFKFKYTPVDGPKYNGLVERAFAIMYG